MLSRTVTELDNYDITVGYGASYDPKQVSALKEEGIETKSFPLVRHYNPITAFPAVLSIARYLRQQEFDIVHTHSTEAGIIGRTAAALAGTPNVVHTIHGVPFTEDRHTILNAFIERCERWVAPHTDRMVAIADVIADEYLSRDIGTPEQYRTIYCGIPVETFTEVKPATDLPGERPRVLMVGRLVAGKGLEVLLDAVESLDESATVLVAGDGPKQEAFEAEIIERGLEETVYPLGFRTDIPEVMAASDILVHPSFREGTPLVVFEAMASGLPVIATDIAGLPEQVQHGETGYLIPPGNAGALADHLQKLLFDPVLRERMGKLGLERAKRFSVDAMLGELDELYKALLAESDERIRS